MCTNTKWLTTTNTEMWSILLKQLLKIPLPGLGTVNCDISLPTHYHCKYGLVTAILSCDSYSEIQAGCDIVSKRLFFKNLAAGEDIHMYYSFNNGSVGWVTPSEGVYWDWGRYELTIRQQCSYRTYWTYWQQWLEFTVDVVSSHLSLWDHSSLYEVCWYIPRTSPDQWRIHTRGVGCVHTPCQENT